MAVEMLVNVSSACEVTLMNTTRLRLVRCPFLFAAGAALVLLGTHGSALGQNEGADSRAKASNFQRKGGQPQDLRSAPTAPARVSRSPRAATPKPTVVLKPGEIPKVEFDTPTWDFGRIRARSGVSHDFWFTNTGTGPLEILKVKGG